MRLEIAGIVALAAACGSGDASTQPAPARGVCPGCTEARDLDPFTAQLTFVTVGDHGAHPATDAVFDLAAVSGELFLSLGDLSYGVIEPEQAWCDYARRHLGTLPFLVVAGNHEEDRSHGNGLIDDFIAPGCLPAPFPVTGDYAKQYWFDYPPQAPLARFIQISPDLEFSIGGTFDYALGSPRYQWTAQVIAQARAARIPWVIVAMHTNCISAGRYGCEGGTAIFDLLLAERVDLILQGHEHSYQRSHQLTCAVVDRVAPECVTASPDSTYARGAGSVLAIVGTGGREPYALSADDPEAGYFAALMDTLTSGLLQITVTPDRLDAAFLTAHGEPYSDAFHIQ
jgi:hypothetical protein